MLKKSGLFVALCVIAFEITIAQNNTRTELSFFITKGRYTLKQIIDSANAKGVNISYKSGTLQPDNYVKIPGNCTTVRELANALQQSLDVDCSIEGNTLFLKNKQPVEKIVITGIVTDKANSELLPGASVYIKDSHYGISTNIDGSYKLKLTPGKYIIVASFTGYATEERTIELTGDTSINFMLAISEHQIDEVRVTKQRDFWGNLNIGRSISSIDSKKIHLLNTNNASDILQASVSGVWSSQTSGAPGDHQKIRIRGMSSLFGCSDPLYIIDGVAVPIVNLHSLGIGDLNIYDIEKVTVLKDAASTALYGYQGANGVVIIDTKRKNESRLSFSAKYGVQVLPRRYDLMNTKDFLSAMDTAKKYGISVMRKFYPAYSDTLQITDWQDVVFRTGIGSEFQLTGSQSFGNTNIYFSGNYYTQQGIVENSNYRRYNFMANLGRNITKRLSAELNFRTSNQINQNNLDQYYGNDLIVNSITKSPCLKSTADTFYFDPPRTPKPGILPGEAKRTFLPSRISDRELFGEPGSPEQFIKLTMNKLNTTVNSFNLTAKYIFAGNIFLNASSSATFRNNRFHSQFPLSLYGHSFDWYYRSSENYVLLNQQINLNLHHSINDHDFILVAGYRNYGDNANWNLDSINGGGVLGFKNSDNYFLRNSLAANGDNGSITRIIQSFSAHLNYNYKKNYYLSFIINRENLQVNKLVNISNWFPSAALNWDISHEPMLNQVSWLKQFNVFANIGLSGNYPVSGLSTDFYNYYKYSFNDSVYTGKGVVQFANHHLKSEISKEYNLGANIGLFGNKILLEMDYYNKINSGLIILRDIPQYYLGGKIMYNIGKISNNGIEFSLKLEPFNLQNFNWYSNFTISFSRQKVLETGPEEEIVFTSPDILIPKFVVSKDQELGNIRGFRYLGTWTSLDDSVHNIRVFKLAGGKYYKEDTLTSGLTEKDKVVIGNSIPDYTWHWSNSFTYKRFSLDILFYGVAGVDKYNATRAATYISATNREILNLMQPGNKTLTLLGFYQSSYFVEDAGFIRLKQITLSYTLPKKITRFGDLTFSVSADNLITFTKYTGYDPEASIYTDNSFSDFAVDRGAYPIPRSMYFSIKIDF
jgi:TonB-dependent starch-binding outer membrane protein SusC